MAKYKEFRFRIDGEVGGKKITPRTLPMARLAEYISDLAALLGHKEHVHFIKVGSGSAAPQILIDADAAPAVVFRAKQAQKGIGPKDANAAYARIDDRLREDKAIGEFREKAVASNILEFPGRTLEVPSTYGPIVEPGTVIGELKRVGGLDETVPVWLKREDGTVFRCTTTEAVAERLAPLMYKTIKLHGIGKWYRDEGGGWKLREFTVNSFEEHPLSGETLFSALEKIRQIPNSGWNDVEDPLEELRKIRHGEDKPKQ